MGLDLDHWIELKEGFWHRLKSCLPFILQRGDKEELRTQSTPSISSFSMLAFLPFRFLLSVFVLS